MNPYILWFLGLLLILLEFYIPGAIMGIAGGVMVFMSVLIFASESQSPLAITLFLTAVITSIILLIRFALWRIPRSKPGYSIYSDKDQTGYVASEYDKSAIGKEGNCLFRSKAGRLHSHRRQTASSALSKRLHRQRQQRRGD